MTAANKHPTANYDKLKLICLLIISLVIPSAFALCFYTMYVKEIPWLLLTTFKGLDKIPKSLKRVNKSRVITK